MTSKPYTFCSPASKVFITLIFILKTDDINKKIKGALLILNNPDSDSSILLKRFILSHRECFPREVLHLLKRAILPTINNKRGTIATFKKAA